MREFPLETIFNVVYHTPGVSVDVSECPGGSGGSSVEVQMAWGGSSTYTFQVRTPKKIARIANLIPVAALFCFFFCR